MHAHGRANLSWTTFYLACLENKEEVQRLDVKPRFHIVCTVARPCLSVPDLCYLNHHGKLYQIPFARSRAEMDIQIDMAFARRPTELFKKPAVVKVIVAGFDKPANASIFTLRFPRIQKIHEDRSFQDGISLIEYQRLAEQSRGSTGDDDRDLEPEGQRNVYKFEHALACVSCSAKREKSL